MKHFSGWIRSHLLWIVGSLLLLLLLLFVASNLPLNYRTTQVAFQHPVGQEIASEKYQEFQIRLIDSVSEKVPEGAIDEHLMVGDVIVEEFNNLFGMRKFTISAPFILRSVRDVGTAGRTDWTFQVGLFSLTWNNEHLMQKGRMKLGNSTFSIVADKNTALDIGVRNLDIDNQLSVSLQSNDLLEPNLGAVMMTAATIDSGYEPNAPAAATLAWQGQIKRKFGPITLQKKEFTLESSFDYISNLQY